MQELDEILRLRRIELNMTMKAVADRAEIGLRQYQRFEGGERDLKQATFDVACRVIEALELDITEFFHENYIQTKIENKLYEESLVNALVAHKKAAIITKARNSKERAAQRVRVTTKCPDIEIVKEYPANYMNIDRYYDEMLKDAQEGMFDLVLATNVKKFAGANGAKDSDDRICKLAKTGVAIYCVKESYYYRENNNGSIVKGII